jgi:UDP-glucose 4-epimerase
MIFVAGGAGYIGSHCVKTLGDWNRSVLVYDNLSRGHRDMAGSGSFIEGDLSETNRLTSIFKENSVDTVVHFAASSLVGESESVPHLYYRNNVANGISLLDAMLKAGVGKIVFSSSAAVYGEPCSVPIDEGHPTAPTNVYGQTKLIFENILQKYSAVYGLRFVSLRYFNAAGAHPDATIGEDHNPESHLIPLILDAAMERSAGITVFGTDYETPDGTCIRDYIHVTDLALAHVLALDQLDQGLASGIYNLGSERGFSVKEVIHACERVTGRGIPVRWGLRRAGDPARLVASSQKIKKDMGWNPAHSDLETIIETAWRWHRLRFG